MAMQHAHVLHNSFILMSRYVHVILRTHQLRPRVTVFCMMLQNTYAFVKSQWGLQANLRAILD